MKHAVRDRELGRLQIEVLVTIWEYGSCQFADIKVGAEEYRNLQGTVPRRRSRIQDGTLAITLNRLRALGLVESNVGPSQCSDGPVKVWNWSLTEKGKEELLRLEKWVDRLVTAFTVYSGPRS